MSNFAHWKSNCWGLMLFNLVLGIYIILANSVVVAHYCHKIKETVPLMFTSIGCVDILTGISALLQSLFFGLILGGSCRESIDYLTILLTLITMWTIRISCFLSTTLGIIRTINILQPFAIINRRLLIISVISYSAFLWPPVLTYQVIANERNPQYYTKIGDEYKMKVIRSASLAGDALVHLIFKDDHTLPVILCVFIPFLLPAIISTLSSCLQIHTLLTQKVGSTSRL